MRLAYCYSEQSARCIPQIPENDDQIGNSLFFSAHMFGVGIEQNIKGDSVAPA
jgi:hypothetical protein